MSSLKASTMTAHIFRKKALCTCTFNMHLQYVAQNLAASWVSITIDDIEAQIVPGCLSLAPHEDVAIFFPLSKGEIGSHLLVEGKPREKATTDQGGSSCFKRERTKS